MENIFAAALRMTESGQPVMLVTVIGTDGSAPRGPGARMAVPGQGDAAGTIGGGAVEYRAAELARQRLAQDAAGAFVEHFDLGSHPGTELGMVCGGTAEVLFQPLDASAAVWCRAAARLAADGTPAWLAMALESGFPCGVWQKDGAVCPEFLPADAAKALEQPAAGVRVQGGRRFYAEPLCGGGRVLVFGGGHVARCLVPLLSTLGFFCTVLDDRPEFAAPGRFPDARAVRLVDFARIGDAVTVTPEDYAVIMTRGHQHDYEAQAHALRCGAGYIGVMGSRHKIAFVTQKLLADGFAQSEIDRCQMPIGTDILAQTPEEIAVSVAGELIRRRALRRGGK
jgi:xanthine dehydrogenase accessory factor